MRRAIVPVSNNGSLEIGHLSPGYYVFELVTQEKRYIKPFKITPDWKDRG